MFILAGLLVIPTVVRAYAHESPQQSTEPVIEQTEVVEEETVEENTPVPEVPAPEVEEEVVEESPVEDPSTPITSNGVTLGEAQIIAQAEHSGSTIKAVKTKVVEGNAVYVFHFEDGWKVTVRAIDGLVLEVKDPSDKKHDCKNKLKDDAQFQSWLQERKDKRKVRSGDQKPNNDMEREHRRKSNRDNSQDQRGGWRR